MDLSEWTPRPLPQRRIFEGRLVRLEPFDADGHALSLYQSMVGDEEGFRYLREDPPKSEEELREWMEEKGKMDDPLYFAVISKETGKAVGRQSLLRTDKENGVTEMGHIYWSPLLARTTAATEALFLLAEYVFDELKYRRLEWKCNNDNEKSKRAAERLGFRWEAHFRQHMIAKGRNWDSCWYSIIDKEWPPIRESMRGWLDEGNFDREGRQKRGLEDICVRLSIQSSLESAP